MIQQSEHRRSSPAAVYCSACGTGNPNAARYCRQCGTVLPHRRRSIAWLFFSYWVIFVITSAVGYEYGHWVGRYEDNYNYTGAGAIIGLCSVVLGFLLTLGILGLERLRR